MRLPLVFLAGVPAPRGQGQAPAGTLQAALPPCLAHGCGVELRALGLALSQCVVWLDLGDRGSWVGGQDSVCRVLGSGAEPWSPTGHRVWGACPLRRTLSAEKGRPWEASSCMTHAVCPEVTRSLFSLPCREWGNL